MHNKLFISLGHNASAVFKYDYDQVIGYEEERLDKIKASSCFPSKSILEIIKNVGIEKMRNSEMYISHWFDTFDLDKVLSQEKYVDKKFINNVLLPLNITIKSHSENFTHHDAHASSALTFFNDKNDKEIDGKLYTIVADGFGNLQEVFSLYQVIEGKNSLITRFYGYKSSLGLMYQYATSFVGMKENQDEYKFLGYESHILEYLDDNQIELIEKASQDIVHFIIKFGKQSNPFPQREDGYISVENLQKIKQFWHHQFSVLISQLNLGLDQRDDQEFLIRIVVGHLIQEVIEIYMASIISDYNIENVLLSGGLFYNVKLNNFITKQVKGIVSVVPACGDQGASIGYEQSKFKWGDLCFGVRDLSKIAFDKIRFKHKNILHFDLNQSSDVIEFVSNEISKGNIVNFVKGNGEYGPRALCNTSTLMLPTKKNADLNNFLNTRNEVMPVCPVVNNYNMDYLFGSELSSRVIGSDKFMVITYDFKDNNLINFGYDGVMHKYPLLDKYSGRPQVIDKIELMYDILNEVEQQTGIKCIINTSYNAHGSPINLTIKDCVDSFHGQIKKLEERKECDIFLVFYNGK